MQEEMWPLWAWESSSLTVRDIRNSYVYMLMRVNKNASLEVNKFRESHVGYITFIN